jgi:hypothetical protein
MRHANRLVLPRRSSRNAHAVRDDAAVEASGLVDVYIVPQDAFVETGPGCGMRDAKCSDVRR